MVDNSPIYQIGDVAVCHNKATNHISFVDDDGSVILFNAQEATELKELLNEIANFGTRN